MSEIPQATRSTNTLVICGTIILLACVCAVVYFSYAQTNDMAALGLIGTIVAGVLGGVFGVTKLAKVEGKLNRVELLSEPTGNGFAREVLENQKKQMEYIVILSRKVDETQGLLTRHLEHHLDQR